MTIFARDISSLRGELSTALTPEQKRAINSAMTESFHPNEEIQKKTQEFICLRTLEILEEKGCLPDFIRYAESLTTAIEQDGKSLSETIKRHGLHRREHVTFAHDKTEQAFASAFNQATIECAKILNPDVEASRHTFSRRALLGAVGGFVVGGTPPIPKTVHETWKSIANEPLPGLASHGLGATIGYTIGAYHDEKTLDAEFAALMKARGKDGVSISLKKLLQVTADLGNQIKQPPAPSR